MATGSRSALVFRSISLILILFSSANLLAFPIIKINEVASMASPDWAELYCVDDGNGGKGVDISGFMLTDLDGKDTTLATSKVTIRTGEYVVIHWGDGEDEIDLRGDVNGNGYRDLYLDDEDPTNTDDQLLLMDGDKWLDAVAWANHDGVFSIYEKGDTERLVERGQWRRVGEAPAEPDCVNSGRLTKTSSIGRDRDSRDTDTKDDWFFFQKPTPGKRNPSPLPHSAIIRINEVSFKERDGRDWVEFYCVDDGGGEVDLGGCFIMAGATILKVIGDGTIMRKGDYMVLHQGVSKDDTSSIGDGVIDIFAKDTALTSSDSQLILYDGLGGIEDAVCWADQDGIWSSQDGAKLKELSDLGQWAIQGKRPGEEDCVDSSLVKTGYSIARDGVSKDTNTKDDWAIDQTPSMGRNNREKDPFAKIDGIKVSNRYILVDGSDNRRKETVVSFFLNVPCQVTVRIYDVEGVCVRVLVDREELLYGENRIVWDGKDDHGRVVPIGIYICYIEAVDKISRTAAKGKVVVVAAKDLD